MAAARAMFPTTGNATRWWSTHRAKLQLKCCRVRLVWLCVAPCLLHSLPRWDTRREQSEFAASAMEFDAADALHVPTLGPTSSTRASEIVLAMLVPDEEGRHDVATSYALAPCVFPTPAFTGGSADSPLMATAAELEALSTVQRPVLQSLDAWRSLDRLRTAAIGIIVCLNIGTDPPDVEEGRTPPYARDESWIDPTKLTPQRAINAVGALCVAWTVEQRNPSHFAALLRISLGMVRFTRYCGEWHSEHAIYFPNTPCNSASPAWPVR